MTLSTEDLDEIPNVDAATMDEVLSADVFGKFAILSAAVTVFIQAGNDWQPGPECEAFMDEHGDNPWLLEYRKGKRQYRAAGHVTLDQVREAFRSDLTGGTEWRAGFTWEEIKA